MLRYQIQNFILSFDEPYDGAKSFLSKNLVHIKKTQLHVGEIGNHPYQTGVVIRKNKKWIIVALKNQFSLIIQSLFDNKGNDILTKVKLGDRFYTPHKELDKSFEHRSYINKSV